MSEFLAHSSRSKSALLVLASGSFVGVGLWLAGVLGHVPEGGRYHPIVGAIVGWASVVFGGVFGVLWSGRLFSRSVQVAIGHSGIRYAHWSGLTIPWSEITDVTTWTSSGQKWIILHLRNPELFPGRFPWGLLPGIDKTLTGGDIGVSLAGTDRSFEETMAAIERFRSPDSFAHARQQA